MKVVRVLVYEGPEANVQYQLGQSLPDGYKEVGLPGSPGDLGITVLTVPPELLAQVEGEVGLLQEQIRNALNWEGKENQS